MPPILYLLRHAHALDAADDDARTLSESGHRQLARLGQLLRSTRAFQPAIVWHSPLVRARETAERLTQELKLTPAFAEQRELEPEADPTAIVHKLQEVNQPLALVGHEPHMSALASLLVTGSADHVVFRFDKATLLALHPLGRRWCVRWQLSPELFE